jgi:hypothetical protein
MKTPLLFNFLWLTLFTLVFAELNETKAQTIQLGSGTAVNGTTVSSPVNIYYRRTVSQFVYTAAELNAAGILGPCNLQDLGWYVTASPLYSIPNYTVKMKHVAATDVATALGTTGWTTVKNAFTYNPTAGGWDMLGLNNPFVWNGVDNIGVELCWSQVTPNYSASGQCRLYTTPNGYRYTWSDATGSSCGSSPATTSTNKPQAQMVWGNCAPPCSTPNPPSVNGGTTSCGNGLTLSAAGTPSGGTYNWYSDAAGTTLVGTGSNFTINSLYSNTFYYVGAFVSPNCESSLVPVSVNVTSNITPPTASNLSINCGNAATLTASGSTGNFTWYSDANGTNTIGTGNVLSLGTLYADLSVYVAANSSSGTPTVLYQQNWQSGQADWIENNSGPFWNRISGQTGSTDTGPTGGSNSGTPTSGNFYLYLETSSVAGTSYLTGPGFTVSAPTTFQFDYHMYGASMGTLAVEAWNGFTWNTVWTLSGQQQTSLAAAWTTVSIPLTGYSGAINVRFVGTRGGSFTSDMCVDNLLLTELVPPCFSSPVPVTVTVVPPSALTVTGNTQICASNTTTLSTSGTSVEWYSDANRTNIVGTGNSFTTPILTANTTYYAGESSTFSSGTYDQTISVQGGAGLSANTVFNFPGTPTGATGTPTLTISTYGDIDGIGTNLEQWRVDDETGAVAGTAGGTGNFNDQCGTTIVTVINLTAAQIDAWAANGSIDFTGVDPTGNINYTLCTGDYLQLQLTYNYASGNPCTPQLAQVDINIDQPSTPAAIDAVPGFRCPNTTIALTASGGISGSGASLKWYDAPNGNGNLLGTGNSVNVLPTVNGQSYYVRREGFCNNTADDVVSINLRDFVYGLDGASSSNYCTDDNGWNHFYNGNEILLSIQGDLSGAASGYPQITINKNSSGYFQQTEGPFVPSSCLNGLTPGEERFEMGRSWNVDLGPGGVSNSSYNVRFYYEPTEKTAIEIAAANFMNAYPACAYSYKYLNSNGFYWFKNLGSNYVAPAFDGVQLSGSNNNTSSAVNYEELTGITSFSGGSGAVVLVPGVFLPVEWLGFSGETDNEINYLNWATESEKDADYFNVQRSEDGSNFYNIGMVEAYGTTNSTRYYAFEDDNPMEGENYYRLELVDNDGQISYSSTISLMISSYSEAYTFYPNPTKNLVFYQFKSSTKEAIKIEVIDVLGKRIQLLELETEIGKNDIPINVSSYPTGTYMIQVHNEQNVTIHKAKIIKNRQ